MDELSATEFLRLVGGSLCPCGHDADDHEEPDPEWAVGDLRQKTGACTLCACKGVIE